MLSWRPQLRLEYSWVQTSERYGELYEDIPRRVPSVEKAFTLLGWKPRTVCRTGSERPCCGLKRTIGT